MKLIIEPFTALCSLSRFEINGVCAEAEDFGYSYDANPDIAEEHGCGNRQFRPIPPEPDVLKKYGITESEYDKVAEGLTYHLSFGRCGWCV